MILKGRVVSGKHEARFFTLLPHYQKFFRKILGLAPYPGTLNVILSREIVLENVYRPESGRPIRRIAVKRIDRYPINAIGLMPGRNKGRILEIVSTMKLRKFLGLKNGKEVMLSVGGGDIKKRR